MKNISEFTELTALLKKFPRSSQQTHKLFEADCEIVKIASGFLACSVDSIGEEIDIQLYRDPELWGWMTVVSSISDLAASGSQGIGLLLANQWKYKTSKEIKLRFLEGARKALQKVKIPLLGGDSGGGESHSHSATVIGYAKNKPLTRKGIKRGDIICLVGRKKLGIGPSLAYRFLLQKPEEFLPEKFFRPLPSPRLISSLRPLINASIDTSDGLATSLQILRDLNHVGFELKWTPQLVSPLAMKFCARADFHPLMLLMGDHGDFQTLLAIPEKNLQSVLKKSKDILPIGVATSYNKGIKISYENQWLDLPAHLVTTCPRDTQSIYSLTLEVNKLFKSQSSPTKLASKPIKRMTPNSLGEEK